MPLTIVRAAHNAELWERCVEAFLEDASAPGPAGHRAWIWLSHRNLRDRLFEAARARGHDGWLDPPVSFFSNLAELFDVQESPVGLLTRRRILSRHASRVGREIFGRTGGRGGQSGVIRSHILDAVLADLLPEGVSPDELRHALGRAHAGGDDFTRARDRWVIEVYEAYIDELRRLGKPDWRSINAILAKRIEAGGLPAALGGAERLHIYGITSPRTRRRLLRALAGQGEVDVRLYMLDEPDEERPLFADLASAVAAGAASAGADEPKESAPDVQPAPDAAREMAWLAREIKQLVASGEAEPHEIAVVARSGRDDTRRAYRALCDAGVPATARIRTPLAEITALQALLLVFRGAARDWDYRSLRAVLDHPYFDTKVDLRGLDFIAGMRRVVGLEAWGEMLREALRLVVENARETWGKGLFADRLAKDIEAFDAVRDRLEPLSAARTEAEWIALTRALLTDERGVFLLRRRLCDAVSDRWDIVRTDQRGVIQLERLLAEWQQLDLSDDPLDPADWHALLRQLLEGNELVLSTPGQKGVQVLEAHDAGLVPFAHTFVVHANDGEFPRVTGAAGVLSDEERARLNELGIPVDHREASLRRERSLWRAVTRQAGPVRVSYRTTNPSGTPLLPSLMVPEHDPARELPRLRRPADDTPVSPADADQLAASTLAAGLVTAAAARSGSDTTVAVPRIVVAPSRPERLRQAIVAAVAESHRGPGLDRAADTEGHPALRPNPWNGELRDPAVLEWLAQKFDAEYTWSASQLEAYACSPFQFMLERVLRLTGREEAEEETSALTFGGVAHEILERFFREHLDPLPGGLTGPVAQRFDQIARDVCETREAEGEWLGLPALWETSRESIVDAVRGYVEWELGHLHDKGEYPVLVEHEFGYDPEVLLLEGRDVAGRSARLKLRGKIDRVDRTGAPDDPVLHVLDFKSGSTPGKNDYEDGTVLQGALYLEVLASQGHRVKRGRYRSIRNPGRPQNGGLIEHGSEMFDSALALAFSIPVRVRAGRFEAVASRKGGWKDWDVALEIRRTAAQLREGHRFGDLGATAPDCVGEASNE